MPIVWSWCTGLWWVRCYFWYSEEAPGRSRSQSRPILAVPSAQVLGSQVLERPSTWLSDWWLPSCRPGSSWFTVSHLHDAGHPSHDDVTGRHSICRRRTACLEQASSCHPWSVTVVVSLRKAAENLFACLRVAALVTYELAPWKCTD